PIYPQSPAGWQVALRAIKRLYAQRQYKQCTARVSELLITAPEPIHPVYQTFLYFYSAICYEAMGLSAHNYSRNKLPLLHSALDCFTNCSAVLPSPVPTTERYSHISEALFTSVPSDSSSYSDSPGSRTRPSSLASSLADMIERSLIYGSVDGDPFVSHDGDDQDRQFQEGLCTGILATSASQSHLIPSPLNVRKPSGASISSISGTCGDAPKASKTSDLHAWTNRPAASSVGTSKIPLARPPSKVPLKVAPRPVRTPSPEPRHGTHFAEAISSLEEGRRILPYPTEYTNHISNYNSSIRSLNTQITSSITTIRAMIEEVTEMQHARRVSKSIRRSASFWSFSPVKERDRTSSSAVSRAKSADNSSGRVLVTESMEQRIERLRSEGWQTVGTKSQRRGWKGEEYYRAYCSRVLEELYLK
ncbi:uncharacterized protein BO72DRAFT_350825, partial [Aspergillus fijiensis CBS 313.89]